MDKRLKCGLVLAVLMFVSCSTGAVSAANVYNITDESYGSYFNASGYINNTNIHDGDVLDCYGTISNKNMYIDRPLNVTSSTKTAKICNGTINILKAGSGTNITDLTIENNNQTGIQISADNCTVTKNTIVANKDGSSYGIYLSNANNNKITGNNITTTGEKITYGVYLDNSSSNVFDSNTIKTTGASADVTYGPNWAPTYHTIGIFLSDSTGNNFTNNNINTGYSKVTATDGYDTLLGIRVADSNLNNFSGNNITTTGSGYAYNVNVDGSSSSTASSNNTFSGNNIGTIAHNYAASVKVSSYSENTVISKNEINAKANNLAYGVYLENYGELKNVTVKENKITTMANINYVIELYATNGTTITGNVLKGVGNYSMGIGTYKSGNNNITNNTITTIGNNNATKITNYDMIPAGNEGIKLTSNSNSNTVKNNSITSSAVNVIDTTGSSDNIISDNYLVSTAASSVSANVPVAGGSYIGSTSVALKPVNDFGSNSNIYYTVDGSTPTNASAKYTSPISITKTTTLKFIVVDAAGNKSPVYTQLYSIYNSVPFSYTVSVPYKKVWYKHYYYKYYKHWYRSHHKWKYYWKHRSVYKWKYYWKYKSVTRWSTKTVLT